MPAKRVSIVAAREAFAAQSAVLVDWAAQLDAAALASPSSLPAWTVAQLLAHISRSGRRLAEVLALPSAGPPLSIADYVSGYAGAAREIAGRVADPPHDPPADPRSELRDATERALTVLARSGPDPVVQAPRGPIRFSDFAVTRVLELVVHGLDLGVEPHPAALALVTRTLAEMLASRHPGRSVELRVPPYAAVQLQAGPAHRRGTPTAVVESDPVAWVLLATGRLGWAEAEAGGGVRASGARSDLSALLPVLS
jgi:uncharacterized protein (TIGR03083 family)